MALDNQLDKNSAIDFVDGINRLLSGIKKNYHKWTNPDSIEGNIKDIKMQSISDFNDSLNIKTGKKYTKVLQGNTVWGFVANSDGVLKGIPYFKGDVFKPAGWKGPAKHARGSIFDTNTNWFSWTGPNYL